MADQLLFTFANLLDNSLMAAIVFFLALTLKHWLLDYFLIEIERTPFRVSMTARHPFRSITHLCYLQGISTATIIFFLFGPNPQLLWLGLLDAFICLSYYTTRLRNWKQNLFLSNTYIRGIFGAEALRLALTAVIVIGYFAVQSEWTFTHDFIYTVTLMSNAYFETQVSSELLLRAFLYSTISMFGMSVICSVLRHQHRGEMPKLRWTPLVAQFALLFYILDNAAPHAVFDSVITALCVSSTYYYCRVLLARSKERNGRLLVLEGFFYLLIFALFVGLTTFTYVGLVDLD